MSGDDIRFRPIGRIYTDFPTKFGLPRQSAPDSALTGRVVFEPEYRVREAFRGLESVSHIWLLWLFSAPPHGGWSPTVRPPRLGGNRRMACSPRGRPTAESHRPDLREAGGGRAGHARRAGTVRFGRGYAKRHAAAGRQALPALCRRAAGRLRRVRRDGEGQAADGGLPARAACASRAGQARRRGGASGADPRPGYHADPARVYRSPTRARICISRSPTAF